uniref:Uncharacterized protein n=1 Tax=Anguilla anguilla TaxID=7936 RepID=A0A0E9RT68_ANGAN
MQNRPKQKSSLSRGRKKKNCSSVLTNAMS